MTIWFFSVFLHLRYYHLKIVLSVSITNNLIHIFWILIIDMPLNFYVSWINQTSIWLLSNSLNPIYSFENDVIRNSEIISIDSRKTIRSFFFLILTWMRENSFCELQHQIPLTLLLQNLISWTWPCSFLSVGGTYGKTLLYAYGGRGRKFQKTLVMGTLLFPPHFILGMSLREISFRV